MRIRLAKISDAKKIAKIHLNAHEKSPTRGFYSRVTISYLVQYYKIMLNDPNAVVLCAEDDGGIICGFASATLDAEAQFRNLGKHKLRLAISLIPTILREPSILLEAWKRYLSTTGEGKDHYVSTAGPRGEFWAWNATGRNSIWAGTLNNKHLEILHILGVKNLNFEVDEGNQGVIDFSRVNGAQFVNRITLTDGRIRLILNYDLAAKFSRNKAYKTRAHQGEFK